MDRQSQYRRAPAPRPATTPAPQAAPVPYPVKHNAPEPSLLESFQAGWQYGGGVHLPKTPLTSQEWYDLTQLTPHDWIQKYRRPQNAEELRKATDEYRYWSQHARKRVQKMQQPNWLQRSLPPEAKGNPWDLITNITQSVK